VSVRGVLEPLAVGAVAGDHHAQRRLGGRRLEQEVDTLGAIEAADGEHEVLVRVAAVVELLRRRQDDLRLEPERTLEAVGDVARDREQLPRLAERTAVELVDLAARGSVDGALAELAEVGAIELVGLAELVHEPHALVRVPDRVRRELRRDQQVDLPPFDLVQVEQAPRERVRQQPLRRVPLERHGDECRFVPASVQLLGQAFCEHLGTAVRERHLRVGHENPHRRATIA
jgi:hypothetical protein